MLGLEVIEALTNDVEFIDLAGDWMRRKIEVEETRRRFDGRPLVSNSSR
jgi:hypothetical protein